MNIYRIRALLLRLVKTSVLAPAKIFEDIYWPIFDILLWGLATAWMKPSGTGGENFVLVMLAGVIFWNGVIRSNYQICVTMVDEVWERSFVNLFCTPLTIGEWMIAGMILGFFRMLITLVLGWVVVWALYGFNIFHAGPILIPFGLGLLMFGWSMGFFSGALVMYFGQRVMSLVWAISWFFAPFSAVFYPMDTVPTIMRVIGYALPAAHLFDGMRMTVLDGRIQYQALFTGLALAVLFLICSCSFFLFMFRKSCDKGLARLE